MTIAGTRSGCLYEGMRNVMLVSHAPFGDRVKSCAARPFLCGGGLECPALPAALICGEEGGDHRVSDERLLVLHPTSASSNPTDACCPCPRRSPFEFLHFDSEFSMSDCHLPLQRAMAGMDIPFFSAGNDSGSRRTSPAWNFRRGTNSSSRRVASHIRNKASSGVRGVFNTTVWRAAPTAHNTEHSTVSLAKATSVVMPQVTQRTPLYPAQRESRSQAGT